MSKIMKFGTIKEYTLYMSNGTDSNFILPDMVFIKDMFNVNPEASIFCHNTLKFEDTSEENLPINVHSNYINSTYYKNIDFKYEFKEKDLLCVVYKLKTEVSLKYDESEDDYALSTTPDQFSAIDSSQTSYLCILSNESNYEKYGELAKLSKTSKYTWLDISSLLDSTNCENILIVPIAICVIPTNRFYIGSKSRFMSINNFISIDDITTITNINIKTDDTISDGSFNTKQLIQNLNKSKTYMLDSININTSFNYISEIASSGSGSLNNLLLDSFLTTGSYSGSNIYDIQYFKTMCTNSGDWYIPTITELNEIDENILNPINLIKIYTKYINSERFEHFVKKYAGDEVLVISNYTDDQKLIKDYIFNVSLYSLIDYNCAQKTDIYCCYLIYIYLFEFGMIICNNNNSDVLFDEKTSLINLLRRYFDKTFSSINFKYIKSSNYNNKIPNILRELSNTTLYKDFILNLVSSTPLNNTLQSRSITFNINEDNEGTDYSKTLILPFIQL